jgi:hypothetical protein
VRLVPGTIIVMKVLSYVIFDTITYDVGTIKCDTKLTIIYDIGTRYHNCDEGTIICEVNKGTK